LEGVQTLFWDLFLINLGILGLNFPF